MGIADEVKEILLAVQHDTISREDLVRRLEDLEHRAPLDFACQFTKVVAWAVAGQRSRLIEDLKGIAAARRFATRH